MWTFQTSFSRRSIYEGLYGACVTIYVVREKRNIFFFVHISSWSFNSPRLQITY